MTVEQLNHRPEQYAHFPDQGYLFLRLFDARGDYGHAALAEHERSIELHLELSRFGPSVVRSLRQDAAWLHRYARSRGKTQLVGIRQEEGAPDPRWPKFTRLFGFGSHALLQAAFATVGPTPD